MNKFYKDKLSKILKLIFWYLMKEILKNKGMKIEIL